MTFRGTTLGLLAGLAFGATAQAADIDHVLLISVDGLHALDVARFIESHPNSALAELSSHGITYSNARTPANSDSFPGLLALVTGGSPISHGLFYDVSYDRTLFDPSNVTQQQCLAECHRSEQAAARTEPVRSVRCGLSA